MWWFVCVLKVCQQASLSSRLRAKNLVPTCMCYSIPKWAEVCTANQKDVLLRSSIPTLQENVLTRFTSLLLSCMWMSVHMLYFLSAHWPLNTSLPLLNAYTTCKEITVSPAHRWLELCLQSPRWDWIMEYFMKSCLLPNNSLKFQHMPTPHLIFSPLPGLRTSFPSLLRRREREVKFKDSAPTFFTDLKVISYGGLCLAPLLSLAMLQYWWGRNRSRLLAGVAKIMLFVCCENWRPETDWVLSCSQGHSGEFPPHEMGLCLQRSWNMLFILPVYSEWQYGSHSSKMSSLFLKQTGWADVWRGFLAVYLVSRRNAFYQFGERMCVWGVGSEKQLAVYSGFKDICIFTR